MKTVLFTAFLIMLPLLLLADFVENYPVELTQPDGKTINFIATGDEYYGRYFDDKGYTIIADKDGWWVYAEPDGKSIKPSQYRVGEVDPATLRVEPNLKEDPEIIKIKVREALAGRHTSDTRNPTTGDFRNLAVLFKCSNQPSYTSSEKSNVYYDFNSAAPGATSVINYFWQESGEQLTLWTHFAPTGTYTTYGINGTTGYLKPYSVSNPDGYVSWAQALGRIHGIISSMMIYFNSHMSEIPIADYDLDNDGVFDNLNIIIKGYPYLPGTLMWPSTYHWNTDYAPYCYLAGKRIDSFNITFQYSSVGTQNHEFSHSLGFPDLYRSDNVYQPVHSWDVMGVGQDNYWTYSSPQSLVYMKYKYGHWLTTLPPLITAEQVYTLDPINTSPFSAYRMQINPTQTLWVEYRREIGAFESSVPGSGLIFYRVNSAAGDGNFEGPPDEVYVYRPGGTLVANGDPDLAFFSEEAGRTAFHPYTDPKPFDAAGITIDNIMITEISSAGESISFRKSNSLSNIWLGINNYWQNPSNWTLGVPTSEMDIQILPVEVGRFYPVVQTANAVCRTMYLAQSASLTVSTYNLRVYENLRAYGDIQTLNSGSITVDGFVTWGNGSTSSGVIMNIYGNMYIQPGSNLNMTGGTLNFTGTEGAGIYVNETAHIYNLVNNKAPGVFGIASTSTHDLYIDGSFNNQDDRYFRNYADITIHLKGNFTNGINGVFIFDAGTLSFEGTSNQSLINNSALTSYFNNLNFNLASGVSLTLLLTNSTSIDVWGNITINSGIFDCNYKNINIKGNWYNNAGVDAFVERDGAVIFKGTGDQYIYNDNFGALVMNKSSGELIFPANSIVFADKYQRDNGTLRVDGGTFVAGKLLNTGIYGTIYVNSGLLDMRQDEFTRMDLNGNLYMTGGTFTINGGSNSDNSWGYGGGVVNLYMTGGVLDFLNQSIFISDQIGEISFYVSGGTIRTSKNYACTMNDIDFSGGTLELYNPGEAFIQMHSTCTVYNLNINKGSVRSVEESASDNPVNIKDSGPNLSKNERLGSVDALTHLNINGVLTINSGVLNAGAYNITAIGGISVYGTLKKTAAGTILSGGDFYWFDGSLGDITAGSISFASKWRFYEGCNVVLTNCPVTFIGLTGSTILSSSATASFGNLTLNGSNMISPDHYIYISDDSTQPLTVTGTLTINPGNYFYLNGKSLQVTGNINLIAGSSRLSLSSDSILKIGGGSILTVNSGATLETIGSSGHPATITHISGNYGLTIASGGNISAEYTIFEYMMASGVIVNSGAVVNTAHCFHYCTFQNGLSAFNGRLLAINTNQVLNIYGLNFPTITGASNWNIAKSADQGTVNCYNYTGSFSGESYDLDTYNRINWMGAVLCDLVINEIWTISNELYVCEENSYGIEIYNMTAYPTYVPVRVDLYYNRETIPPVGTIGDEYVYLDPLAAWEAISIELLAVPSEAGGTWKTWFRLDTLNEIAETNENNNADGYLTTTWLPLPLVQNTTIVFNTSTQRMELTWTYPAQPTINRFKVYRSENPSGPFDTLVGTPTGTYFSPLITGQKYFYQVRAEKTWP